MNKECQQALTLISTHRWAALASVDARHRPCASMVAYSFEPDSVSLLLHLSSLARHTRNLLENPQASLVISEPECIDSDPQTLARLSITGSAAIIPKDGEAYQLARRHYLQRLPDAAPRFDFADFSLFRLTIDDARFVGGFARAYRYSRDELLETAATLNL